MRDGQIRHGGAQGLGLGGGPGQVALRQQTDEGLAPLARRQVMSAQHARLEGRGNPPQAASACLGAMEVLVGREVIEFQQQEGQRRLVALGVAPGVEQTCLEIAAVGDAGDIIDHGLGAQPVALVLEPQVGPDAGLHRIPVHGFGDKVHGAGGKARGFILGTGLGGDEDDGDGRRRRIGLKAGTDLVAIHPRHHDVQQDEVRLLDRQRQGLLARKGAEDVVGVGQNLAEDLDVFGDIVHDEDLGTLGHGAGLAGWVCHGEGGRKAASLARASWKRKRPAASATGA